MPAPLGYVGYTVIQDVELRTCVKTYAHPNHAPSQTKVFDKAVQSITDNMAGFEGGFSLFHFVIQLNNFNGAKKVPAGAVIVARITDEYSREQPCGAGLVGPIKRVRYEKFSDGIDVQFSITGCRSRFCFKRIMDYVILNDPETTTTIEANEHAKFIGKQKTPGIFTLGDDIDKLFMEAISLRLTIVWNYDNCGSTSVNKLDLTSETLDPADKGKVTWSATKSHGK